MTQKTVNKENLKALIEAYSSDKEMLDTILAQITRFEDYHKAIIDTLLQYINLH